MMTPAEIDTRGRLLAEYFSARAAMERADAGRTLTPEQSAEIKRLRARRSAVLRAYRDALPNVPLSRCPFTQAVYEPAFDAVGLDGPWWDYYAPQRPFAEPPAHCVALTGAMRLHESLEDAPFLRVPGPGAPFVYPHLLRRETVQAVLYALPVGRHAAYAIVYYAATWPADTRMPNLWGTNHYRTFSAGGETGWYETFDRLSDWDFELESWIASGKLRWIRPGDPAMVLQTGVTHCPYLRLPGTRGMQRIFGRQLTVSGPSGEELAK